MWKRNRKQRVGLWRRLLLVHVPCSWGTRQPGKIQNEGFERSRSKSSPLEKTRSKLANPVELSWGLAGVSTGVASSNGDSLIGFI